MEDDLNRFDMDAILEHFVDLVRQGRPVGTYFRDENGLQWRYFAAIGNSHFALHGEFGVVLTVHTNPNGSTEFKVELKKISDEQLEQLDS